MEADYVIVGSGLTGSVIGRMLVDAGASVLILDRRRHFGGNVYDDCHASGIRVHMYGPHYFRTSSEKIWNFVTRFAEFYKYEAVIKTLVDGSFENWPIARAYITRTLGENWKPSFQGEPSNFEEASLKIMPALIYEKFVKGYSEKQWGVKASSLSANLAKRFDVRQNNDPRLMQHPRQGLPVNGYAGLMANMLSGIPVVLNCDYLSNRDSFKARKKLIYTGAIDEFFGFDLGRLEYRGQKREHLYERDASYLLPCGQVNNPGFTNGPHIRTMEWKHMLQPEYAEQIRGTVLTKETAITPSDPNDYEYPFPSDKNRELYESYRARLVNISGLQICGRLGEYRYYDMDQAIGRAMVLAEEIQKSGNK
jgi:UDP-galactopyranose mutase